MDGIPATLADPDAGDYIPELLVVGAVFAKGDLRGSFSNYDAGKGLPHVHAGGVQVKCPDIDFQDEWLTKSGTSHGKQQRVHFSIPYVAAPSYSYAHTQSHCCDGGSRCVLYGPRERGLCGDRCQHEPAC